MTKTKTTKRALLMSVLSMLLCVSMLVGSTFAWFTDSVTSGNNKIVAGNLDIELDYATAFNEDGSVKTWTPVTAETELFKGFKEDGETENLWEPGHTEYVCLRVHNAGSLALKYQFAVNVYGDKDGQTEEQWYTNVNGEQFQLSKSLVFSQTDGAKKVNSREDLWIKDSAAEKAAMGKLDQVGLESDKMLPNEEKIVTLAVYMPTQVGNEANYRGDRPEIYLGLSVTAIQAAYEPDSFGNQYDDGLYPPDEDGAYKRVLDDNTVLYYLEDGEVLLYDTQNVSIGEDGVYTVPAGVTTIGVSSFRYNSDIKEIVLSPSVNKLSINAFRGTSAERIVLNEGLTSIGERVFRDANNLKSVVIPSTVTKIEKQAFQLCGLTELTIPATVTTIEEGAFRDMPNLEELTIEGNPTIANFAGRSCKNLKKVTLTGEDVTFTGTSQVFTHADNGDAAGITIYVVNETVKDRLIAAQTTAWNYQIVVMD